ncbi:hypothetical protein BHF68_08060 [Desulfuribacillus alkaliarsenatis]|uniref:HTH tetR-type domain-containing protein n=2 Tax=Desulfuribacillus alkaliarsenatis TaxID=766136 RepID=A0A1E5G176_9FIRM|nr:hypothetical protein BHF68_08060 [Desulfuribacillus alkaliarsenatis]
MNEKGIQSLTTKEIANREGITEGAIYKHFTRKNDIILSVLDHFAKYDQDINKTIELKKLDSMESIRFYFEAYTTYYQNYPAITVVLLGYDQFRYDKELEQKIKEIIYSRSNYVSKLIKQAQDSKLINQDIDHILLADVFIGSFNRLCLKWRLQNYNFSLKDKGLEAITMLLCAFAEKTWRED